MSMWLVLNHLVCVFCCRCARSAVIWDNDGLLFLNAEPSWLVGYRTWVFSSSFLGLENWLVSFLYLYLQCLLSVIQLPSTFSLGRTYAPCYPCCVFVPPPFLLQWMDLCPSKKSRKGAKNTAFVTLQLSLRSCVKLQFLPTGHFPSMLGVCVAWQPTLCGNSGATIARSWE